MSHFCECIAAVRKVKMCVSSVSLSTFSHGRCARAEISIGAMVGVASASTVSFFVMSVIFISIPEEVGR